MARALHRALLLASLLLAAGCFLGDPADGVRGAGGGFEDDDDDDDALLLSGVYGRVDSSVEPMTCGLSTAASLAQFDEVEVDVTSTYVDLYFDGAGPLTYTMAGTSLLYEGSPFEETYDLADPAVAHTDFGFQGTVDCVLDFEARWVGEILGYNVFMLNDVYRFDAAGGTECGLAATSAGFTSLPCVDSQNTTWAL